MSLCLLLAAQASAVSLTVTRLPGDFGTVKFLRGGKSPSTAQVTFKVNWNVTEAEAGSGQLCLAVASDLATPQVSLSFTASGEELGRPKGGANKNQYGDFKWSTQCFGNFDRFQNTTGSNYQFTLDTSIPGGTGVEVYLLNGAKLGSASDDPVAFKAAVVAEKDLVPYFPRKRSPTLS